MKTAAEWLISLTCPEKLIVPKRLNAITIKRIQLDALEHAAGIITANADSRTRGFNALMDKIHDLANGLPPVNP